MSQKTKRLTQTVLRVIIRDDGPLIHANGSPSYRSVAMMLTADQCAKLELRSIGIVGATEFYEEINSCFLEEPEPVDRGKDDLPRCLTCAHWHVDHDNEYSWRTDGYCTNEENPEIGEVPEDFGCINHSDYDESKTRAKDEDRR